MLGERVYLLPTGLTFQCRVAAAPWLPNFPLVHSNAGWYNPSYTIHMKTAISVPDPLFEAAEAASRRLGVSRSRFYAMALAHFLAAKERSDVTRQLNDVYAKEPSALDPRIARRQAESVGTEDW